MRHENEGEKYKNAGLSVLCRTWSHYKESVMIYEIKFMFYDEMQTRYSLFETTSSLQQFRTALDDFFPYGLESIR